MSERVDFEWRDTHWAWKDADTGATGRAWWSNDGFWRAEVSTTPARIPEGHVTRDGAVARAIAAMEVQHES